ncbi:MAG: FAD:protein FMN transferase [Clostridiales bacterium]|nr:FAD:protein FMN transferase [Clostridiales bacterium]
MGVKRITALLLAALAVCGLTGCGGTRDPDEAQESIQVIAMDTAMVLTAYGKESTRAVYDAEEEVRRLDALLSRTSGSSEVSMLNGAGGEMVPVGAEICTLIQTAGDFTEATGGAFDITIAPVVSAWGFTTDSYQVPDREVLQTLLESVGMEHVHLSGGSARLDPGTMIDLGGIAKGYTADRVAEIFQEHAVPRGKVELGGNILVIGDKPDGTAWRVGVQDPKHPDEADGLVCVLNLTDAFAVTSGSYQRYFEQDGKRYHHIIDPATGCPADSGLTSVTVVADSARGNGTMCDALSTALFVMGEDKALDFWRSGVYDFQLVLVTEDGRVVVTEGLKDGFVEMEESGYTYEFVS